MKILLKKIMLENELSLRQVEHMTGVPRSVLSRINREEISPTLSDLEKIAKGLHIRITDLYESRYK